MTDLTRYAPSDEERALGVKIKSAVECSICGSAADLYEGGTYVCQRNPGHVALSAPDYLVFEDLSKGDAEKGL